MAVPIRRTRRRTGRPTTRYSSPAGLATVGVGLQADLFRFFVIVVVLNVIEQHGQQVGHDTGLAFFGLIFLTRRLHDIVEETGSQGFVVMVMEVVAVMVVIVVIVFPQINVHGRIQQFARGPTPPTARSRPGGREIRIRRRRPSTVVGRQRLP